MSVRQKKGSPFYHYDFQVGGERFSGSTRETDEGKARKHEKRLKETKRAEREARDALMAVTGGVRIKLPEPMTMGAAVERYFNEMVEGRPSEVETETQLARLAQFFGQSTMLHDIGSDAVAGFVSWRKIQKARRKDTRVAPATVNRDTELLRRMMNRARKVWKRRVDTEIEWGELRLEEPEARVRELSPAEQSDLVAVIEAMRPELLAPFLLSLLTGLRQSPVVNLTWHQVDMREKVLRIRLKSRKPGGRILTVPLSAPALAILEAQKGKHATAVFTYVAQKKRAERASGSLQPITASWVGNVWRDALHTAEVVNFRWHDLRHTAATRLLRVSNLAVVKEMLGHKDIASTMKYAHVNVDDVRRAVDTVGMRYESDLRQSPASNHGEQPNALKKKA